MMKSKDMKIKKFEILVRDIDEYLGYACVKWDFNNENEMNILELIFDRKKNNPWLEAIYNNTFCTTFWIKSESYIFPKDYNITKLVSKIKRCSHCSGSGVGRCRTAELLMFWMIFMVAVDNENFNNNLSVVSDMAFLLDFSEDMLEDWITAVKGVLVGKKLKDLSYKTEVGKKFFVRN